MKQTLLATSRAKGNFSVKLESELDLLEKDCESEAFTIKQDEQEFQVTFKVRDIFFDGKDCKVVFMKDVSAQKKLRVAENKT
jgi:hypothetical protein